MPPVAFITCPTKKPSSPSLPLRYAATSPAFAVMISSMSLKEKLGYEICDLAQ